MHPRSARGAIIKIRGILDIALRDPSWAEALDQDPAAAIDLAGLDLTDEEKIAVGDIVRGTANSVYANPPPGQDSKYPELREEWLQIARRNNLST